MYKMPQVHCYLNQKMADQLEQIREEEGYDSLSQAVKEMLSLGMKVHLVNKENPSIGEDEKKRFDKEEELRNLHTEYLLRMLELSADTFRCVYDKDKIKDAPDTAGEHIVKIKHKITKYLDDYVNSK